MLIYYCIIYLIVNSEAVRISRINYKKNITRNNGVRVLSTWLLQKQNEEPEEFQETETTAAPRKSTTKRQEVTESFLDLLEFRNDDDQEDKFSDDYYEKKEWSDLHRNAQQNERTVFIIDHTEILDIDGLVDVVSSTPSPTDSTTEDFMQMTGSTQKTKLFTMKPLETTKKDTRRKPKGRKVDEYVEYEDATEKSKAVFVEYEPHENEAKRLSMLDKQVKEQRMRIESLKEEEMYVEEQENDKFRFHINTVEHDKYDRHKPIPKLFE